MKTKSVITRVAFLLLIASFAVPTLLAAAPARPQGPCDIYGAAGTPCVAAHSTTRALYASYNGPLYQLLRRSDGKTLDIGVAKPSNTPLPDAGGYANAASQDAFCANTICVINLIYDQSGKGNHLYQAGPGTFKGPEKAGFDTQPIADMAPITIGGHKAYGVFIMPGMGFRNNNASGIAINDEPEGIYYVIDGKHYDSGCCFDYGNSSTNGRAVGTGTMETTYFGNSTVWGSGAGTGPWIMSDMEAGLFSGYNARQNAADPTIDSWRFVTAVVDGGGGNRWDLRGGDAQKGGLTTFYSGVRPGSPANANYFPMHKQGGILLGTGGDNGNGSSGTFFEGVMTTGYPTEATTDAVQANIVAAKYDVQRVSLPRVTAFQPNSTQEVTVAFTNTLGAPALNVTLSLSLPNNQWTSLVSGTSRTSAGFPGPIAPGASVSATFKVTSPAATGAGFLTAKAQWSDPNHPGMQIDTTSQPIRNVLPIKINEVRLGSGNSTNQFIELYNASSQTVDLSKWSLVHTASQWAPVTLATIPAGTKLANGAFYLLGSASAGLAAPANPGATVIHALSTAGFAAGQQIDVDGETRSIASLGTAASPMTTVFVPVSTGPWITIPAGATNLPVASTEGFKAGEQVGIDLGKSFELATVTAVGKAATQTTLAASAVAGATNIKVAADSNITVGDTLTIGTAERKELAKVATVGTNGASGTGINLTAPLKFGHNAGIDVSDVGTGISFTPATRFPHRSADSVQAFGTGITLDHPLSRGHAYGAPVVNPQAATTGYQGPPLPNQWFGTTLSGSAGSIELLDATGKVMVDAIVYGSQQSNSSANGTIASPEIAVLTGDQGKGGCIVVVPNAPGSFGAAAVAGASMNRSVGRLPDGFDSGSICADFRTQVATTLPFGAAAGATNIKVASVANFVPGQLVAIDTGDNVETTVIATVGTAGASTVGTPTDIGATVIPVASVMGFSAGQTIFVDTGASAETAVIASVAGGRGGARITMAAPLKLAHSAGAQVSGAGITLATPLARTHTSGAQIASDLPTPGAPNKFSARPN